MENKKIITEEKLKEKANLYLKWWQEEKNENSRLQKKLKVLEKAYKAQAEYLVA